ncbi:MAG: adenosine deaminase [Solirubrobacterales bacterium]|nr:adenosine deaminase [Solirubrobacterales bacterium]MBV9941590.1 adenosine deaminase [Solirubrobacterales bacterium]
MIDPLTLPKAELHLHIEGTLEPELMFKLARRNGVRLPYPDAEAVRRAYRFSNLQSFLDVYYRACSVLIHERDFYELTAAYLARARDQGVRHVEIFFDPQTHAARGVQLETVVRGIGRALTEARQRGMTSYLIMCFLRDRPVDDAMATLEQALAHRDAIFGVGLDSAEVGHPPEKFRDVFDRAINAGFRAVAHAGEEGPPEYIWQALDVLGAERIDHGVRCLEDRSLVQRLGTDRIPLTVCPFSNVKLRVVGSLEEHPLAKMLDHGLCATVNSDDPAYFGGYVGDNLAGVAEALRLDDSALVHLARNSFEASFLDDAARARHIAELTAAG